MILKVNPKSHRNLGDEEDVKIKGHIKKFGRK